MKNTRVPPGQSLRTDFPVLHFGDIPALNEQTWRFTVTGLAKNPLTFTYKEFLSLPSAEIVADFHCVTGWSQLDLRMKGVLFTTIASMAEPSPEAQFAFITCDDGYSTNMPISVAMDSDVIFIYEYEGKPITPEHGFPVRLMVPKRYAYKAAKWARGIEFLKNDRKGFWETRGYNNTADPWKEERYE